MDQADVGLMAMYVMDCKALAEIAGILDRRGDREEREDSCVFHGGGRRGFENGGTRAEAGRPR